LVNFGETAIDCAASGLVLADGGEYFCRNSEGAVNGEVG
jgi:hypothetical protein